MDIAAGSCMKIYGSLIKAVTNACAVKDSKNNLFLKRVKNIKNETNLKITFYDGTIDAIPKKK